MEDMEAEAVEEDDCGEEAGTIGLGAEL